MPSILNATTTNGLVTSADNSGELQLQTNSGTTAVTITTAQNVGIGTTTPTNLGGNFRTLQLQAGSGSAGGGYYLTGNGTATAQMGVDTLTGYIGMRSNHDCAFTTNNTERMRITSGGSLCVNNTTAQGGQPFYVRGFNGTGSAGFQVFSNGSGAIDWYNASAGYVASVIVNAGSVSYNTTSDYRLKENITPMTGALAKVQALKPVTYTWKNTGEHADGFIAHELAEVCPNAVTGEKDAVDAEGNPKYQGVDTSYLIATLTAAIQELKAELDATKAEVQALKGVA